jgi:hypothetical protein
MQKGYVVHRKVRPLDDPAVVDYASYKPNKRDIRVYNEDHDVMAEVRLERADVPPPLVKAWRWTNLLLVVSNFAALHVINWAAQHNQPLVYYAFINALAASIAFHAYERHKHPSLPGLVPAAHNSELAEELLLTWDRVSAAVCGLITLHACGFSAVFMSPLVIWAVALNLISELHYLRVVRWPWWDRWVYPWAHSAWHYTVFAAAYVHIVKCSGLPW